MTVGPVTFHLYGLIIGIAIWAAASVAAAFYRRQGGTEKIIWGGFGWMLLGGVVGARLYHVFDWAQYYAVHPVEVVQIWRGGLGIWGAIIGGLGGIWLYARIKRVSFWDLADAAAFGAPLGQAIGRWGNWVNQELYGSATTLPWGIKIDGLPGRYQPLFFYESVLLLGLLGVMRLLETRGWKAGKGGYLGAYLAGYGLIRLALEPLRLSVWRLWGMPMASLTAGVMIAVGAGLIVRSKRA